MLSWPGMAAQPTPTFPGSLEPGISQAGLCAICGEGWGLSLTTLDWVEGRVLL
jgi:hypothetical protein